MKSKQVTIVLFLLFIFSGFDSARGENYDFRKTVWGMSKEQVRASENSYPWTQKEDSLLYKLEFLGQKASIEYTFADNNFIYNSTASGNSYGLRLSYAEKNLIINYTAFSNDPAAAEILVAGSNDNNISQSTIYNCGVGLELYIDSQNNGELVSDISKIVS